MLHIQISTSIIPLHTDMEELKVVYVKYIQLYLIQDLRGQFYKMFFFNLIQKLIFPKSVSSQTATGKSMPVSVTLKSYSCESFIMSQLFYN